MKKNKVLILILSIGLIILTNLLPFFTAIGSTIRMNIVGESISTYLLGGVYGGVLVVVENLFKVKIGLLDSFLNYTFLLKLVNVLILACILRLLKKKEVGLILAGIIQGLFAKYIASVLIGSVQGFNLGLISKSLKTYLLSAIISLIIIVLIKKIGGNYDSKENSN